MADDKDVVWVISNRQDDRVVLFEHDERHPGGEAFVGGSAPDKVYKTPEVQRLLREGFLLEIPEPPDSRKKPIITDAVEPAPNPSQPGQKVLLGRKLDPEIVPASAQKAIMDKQAQFPEDIPSTATVPPPTPSQTETAKR